MQLTAERVDLAGQALTFEILKKRQRGIFRSVPVPAELVNKLDLIFGIRERRGPAAKAPLWAWSRTTAWRRVKEAYDAAELAGVLASPKGLRHGLGASATGSGVGLNLVQRWLGHAQISTTAIYAEAVGEQERAIAAPWWK